MPWEFVRVTAPVVAASVNVSFRPVPSYDQRVVAAGAVGGQDRGGAEVLVADAQQVVDAQRPFVRAAPGVWTIVSAAGADDGEGVVAAFAVVLEQLDAAGRRVVVDRRVGVDERGR